MPATASSPPELSSDSPTSTVSRTARHRGLSYWRNYTQNHVSHHRSAVSSDRHRRPNRINHLTRVIGRSQAQPSPGSVDSSTAERTARPQPTPGTISRDRRQCAEGNNRTTSPERTLPSSGGSISGTSSLEIQADPASVESNHLTTVAHRQVFRPRRMVRHRTSAATNGPAAHVPELSHTSQASDNPTPGTTSESTPSMEVNQVDGGATLASQQEQRTDASSDPSKPKQPATIRFYAYQDPHQNTRPSLPFTPMTRTLPSDASIIRVGRYSERDGIPVPNPTEPSDDPVGFKSKVVSRKHCEFSLVNGQWHVRDVGSSSGTFLNHMRLSQPNISSRHYAVRDGDIVQLGIDFRGGEEMIFRSVRIRIECNRMWQQRANEFNKNTETLINNLGKDNAEGYAGCRECSICLGSVLRPYQCLFMAACAHVWHYKCIRRLIHSPEYPMFQCPNCRAYTDLNAEVDDSNDGFENGPVGASNGHPTLDATHGAPPGNGDANRRADDVLPLTLRPTGPSLSEDANLAAITDRLNLEASRDDIQRSRHATDEPSLHTSDDTDSPDEGPPRSPSLIIPNSNANSPATHLAVASQNRRFPTRSETPVSSEHLEDGPLTPRNDSGPLAFDGHAGRL